jgi:hypothetical protein
MKTFRNNQLPQDCPRLWLMESTFGLRELKPMQLIGGFSRSWGNPVVENVLSALLGYEQFRGGSANELD